jgi:hypothetical protein
MFDQDQLIMRTGVVDREKVIGILNRYRVGPEAARPAIIRELVQALTEVAEAPSAPPTGPALSNAHGQLQDLRGMLEWPEVKANPLATARIARLCRIAREAIPP